MRVVRPSVVAISRQYASGGEEIAAALARELGLPLYDREIDREAARESGIQESFFEQAEAARGRLLAHAFDLPGAENALPLSDRLFLSQGNALRTLAGRGPCVVVGHGAAGLLANNFAVFRVFVHADRRWRAQRAALALGIGAEEAARCVRRADRARAAYLRDYSGERFGLAEDAHLCLDGGAFGVEGAVRVILAALAAYESA